MASSAPTEEASGPFSVIRDATLRRNAIQLSQRDGFAASVVSGLIALIRSGDSLPQQQQQQQRQSAPSDTQLGFKIASIVDLSFALPARKKFTLAAHKNALVLTASASDTPVLSVPTESITSLLVLPTPHKPKQNFSVAWTVSSSESDLIYLDKAVLGPSATSDAFLFTFDNAGTQITFKSSTPALDGVLPKPAEKKDRIVEILRKTFEGSACHIEEPSMNVFNVSLGGKLGRQGVCWVDGLVKMKDGHFYMLPNTIFYGFKKPLLLVPIPQVRSISFAFITSRTFTLLVHYYPSSTASSTAKLALETFELEMVDKSELEGVLAYFKGRGVPVASAEELLPGENGNGSSASGSNKGKVVVLGAGEVADGDEDGEAVDASKKDVNGNALFDEDEEDDEDFVANDESDGDDLDEEYDSEHQTDDGSTDDEGDDDDDDEEEDDEDEEPEKIVLLDDDDDMDAEPSGQRAASELQVNSRKRKSEDTLTAAESGKSKRQFIAVDDEDEDEEDVDELAL
ncbi:Rtt106-domain-containing protein [Rhizoclosmatium globosum]|uniref:Rtt106-domain-containing protein n=1 Tax=Rhizoclosmatium globosum TaxID=329046 RepID=A0A1Y2CWW4_9FUNG|nr:Rtt106-domain-containing protein [Rhizoclosmatium globosum]|eukprot:ORY51528.1 Rtt106-domain-containing protein [Rhizoclosmatium globosum]